MGGLYDTRSWEREDETKISWREERRKIDQFSLWQLEEELELRKKQIEKEKEKQKHNEPIQSKIDALKKEIQVLEKTKK